MRDPFADQMAELRRLDRHRVETLTRRTAGLTITEETFCLPRWVEHAERCEECGGVVRTYRDEIVCESCGLVQR